MTFICIPYMVIFSFLVAAMPAAMPAGSAETFNCTIIRPEKATVAVSEPGINQNLTSFPQNGLNRPKRSSQSSPSRIEHAGKALEDLVLSMREFIGDPCFKSNLFQYKAPEIRENLEDIAVQLGDQVLDNGIMGQLVFAQRMFRVLAFAADFLTLHEITSLDEHLLHKVVELSVRLFVLHNSHGIPEHRLPGFAEKVSRHKGVLKQWGDKFLGLRDVPLSTRLLFRSQYTDADKTLENLARYIRT